MSAGNKRTEKSGHPSDGPFMLDIPLRASEEYPRITFRNDFWSESSCFEGSSFEFNFNGDVGEQKIHAS